MENDYNGGMILFWSNRNILGFDSGNGCKEQNSIEYELYLKKNFKRASIVSCLYKK